MATKKKPTKAVAKKEESLIEGSLSSHSMAQLADYDGAALDGAALDITDDQDLFKNDIVIPKIWLIQAMSELRKQKKAEEGDYCDSRSEEVLLSNESEEALNFVVLKTIKRWQTFKMEGEKKIFISSEVMTVENAKKEYKEVVDGEQIVRRQVISAYVLLGRDAQAGVVKPYIIDFAATSKGAGRDLVSDIKVLNTEKRDPKTREVVRRGLPSWVAWFKLGKEEDKIDKDEFFIKTVKFGGMLPQEMFPFLRDAYDEITSLIESNAIEIDDRDVHDSAKAASNETGKVNPDEATEAGV